MPANTTTYEMSDGAKSALLRYSIYVIQGVLMIITNGLIAMTIVWYEALRCRKEYIIIAVLAVADTISGISTAAAGFWRIPLLLSGDYRTRVTRQYCLCTPHVLIWTFLGPAVYSLLALVSFDRLLSVGKPFVYLGLDRKYAYRMVAACYVVALVEGFFTFVTSWFSVNPVKATKICSSAMAYGIKAHSVRDRINIVFIALAIGLYAMIPVFYKLYVKSVSDSRGPDRDQLKLQRKLTKTAAFSCCATFVFVALPMVVRAVLSTLFDSAELFQSVAPWMLIIKNFNPILNFFIYFKRQKEMRMGLKALISNKSMPTNLNVWRTLQTVH